MTQYYQVKVQFLLEEESGKIKKQNHNYLVDALSVTEAETRVTEFLNSQGEKTFEVKAASVSSIVQVVG
jgi:hypothetical protein